MMSLLEESVAEEDEAVAPCCVLSEVVPEVEDEDAVWCNWRRAAGKRLRRTVLDDVVPEAVACDVDVVGKVEGWRERIGFRGGALEFIVAGYTLRWSSDMEFVVESGRGRF
jgi:hypothetical protein